MAVICTGVRDAGNLDESLMGIPAPGQRGKEGSPQRGKECFVLNVKV